MPVVETRDLRKRYGKVEALRGVSLTVERGEIYGLLGQNGAGKTTLIKILLGITKYWKGEARLLEHPAGNTSIRAKVGYLPEDHRFPQYHTAYSLLDFYGQLLGVPRLNRKNRIMDILETVGLRERMHYKIRTYSKGMKQRVGIAQALFHDPEVIFLDEPTDGVDPVGRKQVREMMQKLKEQNVTIFLNSHLLGEVELVCDRVGMLRRGEMVTEGTVEALTVQRGFYGIRLAPEQVFPEGELRSRGFKVNALKDNLWEVIVSGEQSIDDVVDLLRSQQLSIRHLVEKRHTLEDLFLALMDESESNLWSPDAARAQVKPIRSASSDIKEI